MFYKHFGFLGFIIASFLLTSQNISAQMLLGPDDLVPKQVQNSMNKNQKNNNTRKIKQIELLDMDDLGQVTQVLKKFRNTFLYAAPILGIICIFSFLFGFILFVFQKKPKLSVFLMGIGMFIFLCILFLLLWINLVVNLDL